MSNSPRRSRRWLAALTASAVVVGGATLAGGSASAAGPQRHELNTVKPGTLKQPKGGDGVARDSGPLSAVPAKGRYAFLLKLNAAPTQAVFSANRAAGLAAARSAARSHLSAVTSAQNAVIGPLPSNTSVLYRSHALVAGVAVYTNVKNLAALQGIKGVAKVYPIAPKSYSNAYAVPLQGAPQVWEGKGDRGANTSIAIIDTGIDYTHANFGGPGTKGAYQAALATDDVANPGFPNTKVIGGQDLVGDSYNADPSSAGYDPTPAPDPNPLDCGGHGSHVAGSAAGYGEYADGTTYTGVYNTSTPFSTMRIGPGMAPQAKLYAFKVFGCEGSTDVVGEALDMAADPNGDGDTSDAVDVINMSLGADYGSAEDGDSIASNAAVDAGITVAVASGNAGDFTDVGGSPGDANKVITVANSVDASNVIDALNVSAPASIAGKYGAERSVAYDYQDGPDLSGTVAQVTQATNLDGCAPLNPADTAAVVGKIAFVEWTDGASRKCGSVARAANLEAAGASGFIFADDEEAFSAGITGSAIIPGVLVTESAGNAIRGELVAGHTVTVASTTANGFSQLFPGDNDKVNSSSSRGIHATGNVKPDVTAVGTSVFSTAMGTGNDGVSFTGTSMATPMVAGLSALVIAGHPNWTPEQVKADIMNTAGQDLNTNGSADPTGLTYAPARVGAGRIEADPALDNDVLAFSKDDPGSVSLSFGPVAAAAPTTLTKTIKVQNTGLATTTYHVSYDAITSVDGVDYTVSPSSVTVGPRTSTEVILTLSIPDPSVLNKTVDPTVGRDALAAPYPRETLAEASGRVLFTPTSGYAAPQLRVPVYAAPRPVSTMTQDTSLTMPSGASQAATLHLTGGDLGQNGTNGTGNNVPDDDIFSLAAGFELSATDPAQPDCSVTVTTQCIRLPEEREADVKYVGVTSDAPLNDGDPTLSQAYFAISAEGAFTIPASKFDYEIYIDTDGDHQPDLIAYTTRLGTDDVYVVKLVDASTGAAVDTELTNNRFGDVDTALYDSDTLVMPVYLDALTAYGVDASNPRINYGVVSFSAFQSGPVDTVGYDESTGDVSLSADLYHPGVTVSEQGSGPLVDDVNGLGLDVTRNAASYAADQGQGLLMVHFHNAVGDKAQVVSLKSDSTTDLTVAPASVKRGTPATLTATVPSADGVVPTGTVTFLEGATTVGTGTLDASGKATAAYTPTTMGTKTLTAVYAGDANYNGSTSSAVTLTVTPAASGTTLLVVPSSVVRKHSVSLKASVAHGAGDPVPTGTVTIQDAAGKTIGTGALDATGAVSIAYTPKKPGKLALTASYSGDSNYDPSTSAVATLRVTRARSKVKEHLSATSGPKGKTIKVKAKVAKDAGIVPTGNVQLFVNGKKVDSAKLSGGRATLTFTPTKKGNYHVTVKYVGDKSYKSGTSGKATYKAH